MAIVRSVASAIAWVLTWNFLNRRQIRSRGRWQNKRRWWQP